MKEQQAACLNANVGDTDPGIAVPVLIRIVEKYSSGSLAIEESRHRATKLGKGESFQNVKPFIETLRVTNPVRQSRASSREASLAWGRATATAKRRQRDQTLCD